MADVIRIDKLQAGSDLFRSSGYAYVKVTRGGVVEILELAIKSSGVTEVIERLRVNEPKPDVVPLTVTWDSAEGRALGLAKGQKKTVMAPNFGDPKYLEDKRKYDEDLWVAVIDQGLDVPITDENGAVVTDPAKKVKVLKSLGLSLPQFQELVESIQNLTMLSEQDRENFTAALSGSAARTSST